MAVKALNFKMEEEGILRMKEVASVFNMTLTDACRKAAGEYVEKMKKDPFCRLTANVQAAEVNARICGERAERLDSRIKQGMIIL